jgi:hypothetical protein
MITTRLSLVCVAAAALGLGTLAMGCKKDPCSGAGMQVDERPLGGKFTGLTIPPGGTMCRSTNDPGDGSSRHVEFPGNSAEAQSAWSTHLASVGWKDVTPFEQAAKNLSAALGSKSADCLAESSFKKDGVGGRLAVSTSFCDGKGWTTFVMR